jgi:hypothetical protein
MAQQAKNSSPIDYERRDIDGESVVQIGIVVAVVTVVAAVLVLFLFNRLAEQARRADPPNPPLARHEQGRQAPEPRLQEAPFKDIATLHQEERAILQGYGWVDERAGVARIPVEEAMKIVAEQGLPRWSPAPAASPTPAAAPGKTR